MKKLINTIIALILIITLLLVAVDFICFPECYISTWKYQLQNEINSGDEVMIEYYEKTYIANNRPLFD